MDIGEKIKHLRIKNGLTQEELADRSELSKGFISQLERNLTSPSIATLTDILECLGSSLSSFFQDSLDEKVVFKKEDLFTKEDKEYGLVIDWLVPNAQKNAMEPIRITLEPGAEAYCHEPHEGEEFGLVLSGAVTLILGEQKQKVRKGETFYFKPDTLHTLQNNGKSKAVVIWVCTPPSF